MLDPKTDKLLNTILLENLPTGHALRGFLNRVPCLGQVSQRLSEPGSAAEGYAADLVAAVARDGGLPLLIEALARDFPHEQGRLNDVRGVLGAPPVSFVEPSHDLLMDNMAHQFVAELFQDGPSDEETDDLIVGEEIRALRLPYVAVALESLLSVLGNLVLHEHICVEERFAHAWGVWDSPLLGLAKARILLPIKEPEGLAATRSKLYRELFVSPALAAAHLRLCRAMSRPTKTQEESYLSTILWGAAGHLARSAHLGIPYIAQPIRRRFLAQTPFVQRPDAVTLTLGKIDRAQAERFAAIERETSLAVGLVVPPLLVDILGDASGCDDLLKVALQRRDDYRDLRRWLAYFQQAIRDKDVERMMEYQATIKRCVDLAISPEYAGTHRYSVVSRVIDEMPGFHRRAALIMDKLLLARAGEDMMAKLLRFFEITGTSLESPVSSYLRENVLHDPARRTPP